MAAEGVWGFGRVLEEEALMGSEEKERGNCYCCLCFMGFRLFVVWGCYLGEIWKAMCFGGACVLELLGLVWFSGGRTEVFLGFFFVAFWWVQGLRERNCNIGA